MRGAPQVGFSLAIWKINCWSSLEIGVLPICLALDLSRQYRRNARRCHSTTVSGFTTRSEAFHPGHTCLTATQNHLSIPANLGRRFFRFRTETCCRRTRFSSTKLPRRRKRRNMTPKASRKKRNMGEVIADGWVEETVEAVDFAAPHDFGERHPSQMESHRASPLLRSLTQLGRRTAGLLPEDPQLCPHHSNPNRTSGHCLSRPPTLSLRSQTHTPSNGFTSIAAPRNSARVELHYQATTVNLFLRDS
jgi:hypothetical protein